ncbi:MAG: hypothetical protein GKR90_25445 [Pseudomonadales bacterium]|nr:hypothetical protein [Pseudomonadales bacterium]
MAPIPKIEKENLIRLAGTKCSRRTKIYLEEVLPQIHKVEKRHEEVKNWLERAFKTAEEETNEHSQELPLFPFVKTVRIQRKVDGFDSIDWEKAGYIYPRWGRWIGGEKTNMEFHTYSPGTKRRTYETPEAGVTEKEIMESITYSDTYMKMMVNDCANRRTPNWQSKIYIAAEAMLLPVRYYAAKAINPFMIELSTKYVPDWHTRFDPDNPDDISEIIGRNG